MKVGRYTYNILKDGKLFTAAVFVLIKAVL